MAFSDTDIAICGEFYTVLFFLYKDLQVSESAEKTYRARQAHGMMLRLGKCMCSDMCIYL